MSEIFRLPEQEQIRTSSSEVFFPDTAEEKGAFFQSLSLVYNYLKLSGFVLLLGATTLLIFHYKQKIGKIKFWIVILLPLFYYMSTVIDVFGIYIPESDNEIMLYYGLAAVNQVAGGILFAIPFLTMAKSVKENDPTRKYMITVCSGFRVILWVEQYNTFHCTVSSFWHSRSIDQCSCDLHDIYGYLLDSCLDFTKYAIKTINKTLGTQRKQSTK